jgi:geranylgeranyl diphosphate synthase type I
MTDDLLGLWGDPAVTGKPVGADLRKKKKSLPIVLAQQAGGELGAALHHAFAQETLNDGDVEHLMTLMDAAAIRQQAEQEASKHRQRALHSWQRVVGEGVASVSAAAMVAELAEAAVGRAK